MKKKPLIVKGVSICIQTIPTIVVTCIQGPLLVQNTGTTISFTAAVALVLLALIFKANFIKETQTLSWLKVTGVIAALSGLCWFIGKQIFIISIVGFLSGLVAKPFEAWYDALKDDKKEDEFMEKLKSVINNETDK